MKFISLLVYQIDNEDMLH